MIKVSELIIGRKISGVVLGDSIDATLTTLGEPEIFTESYKSYPAMAVYGDLELRFRDNKLTAIALSLENVQCSTPFICHNLVFDVDIGFDFNTIVEWLNRMDIRWEKDELMSDSDQLVIVLNEQTHLSFENSRLTRVVSSIRNPV